jgi:hypothetical protein
LGADQRNWLSVRRQVGYERYSCRAAFEALQQLYLLLRLQLNFFRAVRKLVGKERIGPKVIKRYDQPRTPYQRLLASGSLNDGSRAQLERQYLATNPAELQRRIDGLLRHLWRLGDTRMRPTATNIG